jgi:hypothetical protein
MCEKLPLSNIGRLIFSGQEYAFVRELGNSIAILATRRAYLSMLTKISFAT